MRAGPAACGDACHGRGRYTRLPARANALGRLSKRDHRRGHNAVALLYTRSQDLCERPDSFDGPRPDGHTRAAHQHGCADDLSHQPVTLLIVCLMYGRDVGACSSGDRLSTIQMSGNGPILAPALPAYESPLTVRHRAPWLLDRWPAPPECLAGSSTAPRERLRGCPLVRGSPRRVPPLCAPVDPSSQSPSLVSP